MKIEFTTNAFITDDWKMRQFMGRLQENDVAAMGDGLNFAGDHMLKYEDWVHVGTAHITVELLDVKNIKNKQLAALQAQLQQERADSQVRQNAILEQISKLQALEWDGQ